MLKLKGGLKPSKYNYFVELSNKRVLAYNFFYRPLILLTNNEYREYEEFLERRASDNNEVNGATSKTIKRLVNNNILVEEGFDELAFFKFNYFKSLYNSNTLVVILLPTLNCNLRCPYCFEYKKNVNISDEVIDLFKTWVEDKLRDKKHFHITWFGGEPLLQFKKMKRLTGIFKQLSRKHSCGYSSSLVTNGTLLNMEVIQDLHDMNIHNVQVTFDGAKPFHDKYRVTPQGKGSYDVIKKNVETYCELSKSHLPLGIRVNVTDDNYACISDLFDDFRARVKERSRVFFRFVWANEASGNRVFAKIENKREAYKRLSKLYRAAVDKGMRIDNPIDNEGFNYCEVDFVDHYSVDPVGNLYLCGHSYDGGDSLGKIGKEMGSEAVSQYCKWISANPFEDEVCLNCKALPLCKGGCRKTRVEGNRKCIEEKWLLDDYVRDLHAKHGGAL